MTKSRPLLLAAMAASSLAMLGTSAAARDNQTGEAKLAKLLEGRVAGKPVDCISLNDARDTTIIDKTAIVYGNGRTLWVNRPSNASSLDSDDILVTKTSLSQLCKLDTVQLHDRTSHMWSGFVGLNQFVPWTKVKSR